MTIQEWIAYTEEKLVAADIPSARLDAELLLAHALGADRTWSVAHGDDEIEVEKAEAAESLVARRLQREPIAYITGHKEFYGREFKVTPDVLIPRPETEDLIDLAKEICSKRLNLEQVSVIDVGCGSGCIGISLALEQPALHVTLADISPTALDISRQNAKNLDAKVEFIQSDLLAAFSKNQDLRTKNFSAIIANLPYVDPAWQRSPETDHEPALALFAEDNGLKLIKKLIKQSAEILAPNGYLLLEADPEQHTAIINYAKSYQFKHIATANYALALQHG